MNIARTLDSAVLKPDMTPGEVRAAIELCVKYHSRTVCVRGCDIDLAKTLCEGTDTQVSCVLDFPYGYGGIEMKREAARIYAEKGAAEIDMVMNYGCARGGDWDTVEREVCAVVAEAHARDALVKVIFETSQLTLDQIRTGTEVCVRAGADFVKTSTGFNGGGATVEAVAAMIEAARGRIKVKPSGGIRDYETARKYLDMGADRLGVGYSSVQAICESTGASKEAY
jgi:deoxyribose-phosphate aldolase